MHYLSGISVFVYFILPLLYIYFGMRPIESPEGGLTWAVHFLPYYILNYLIFAHLLGHTPRWRTFVIASTTFPAHLMAALSVVTGWNLRWSVTGVIRARRDYIKSVAPHLLLLLLSVAAIPLGLFLVEERTIIVKLVVTLWLAVNSALLFSVCKRAFPSAQKVEPTMSLVAVAPQPV
jgi:hypothetical protein